MSDINGQDLLDEIVYDIRKKDLLKARLVLASLGDIDSKTQKKVLFELNRADDDFTIPLLAGVIANNADLAASIPLVRETLFSKVLDSPQVLLDLLKQSGETLDRAFLAEIAGEIHLENAVPILLEILAMENDLKIIEATILSLGMIGDASATAAVSEYLYAGTRDVVITSVRTLGALGTPSAIQHLADRLGGDSDVDLMIVDIFATVQIPEALEKLNDTLASPYAHVRTAGKQKLRAVGVTAVRVLIRNLTHDNTDLVIHSLNVLGDIGAEAAIPAIRKLLHNEPEDPNVRFAAYETLGRLPLQKGAFVLAAGLEDPDDNVQAAAASAINRNYDTALAAGMKNMIRSGDAEAVRIIQTIIDAQCDNIFLGLLGEDFFQKPALEYLADKAHPDIRSRFAEVLEKKGHDDLAKQIASDSKPEAGAKLKVFAVDDSKMILSIYRSMLHNLGCDPQLFEFPAGALERLRKEKPDVILTDLNMPEITGIDFTRGVRQLYGKEELPVIMVTTQNEAQDNEAACAAGVNAILHKPFTEEQIAKALTDATEKK